MFTDTLWHLLTTPYLPEPGLRSFLSRAQTQQSADAEVTVAVLDADESRRLFGVPLARRGIQPVYLRLVNRSAEPLRLQLVSMDPNYYSPLEAAARNHYSISRRLSAFGLLAWVFAPLLVLIPLKLITAWLANGRMDEFFRSQAFRLRPIPPGGEASGFVFTPMDAGTKVVHVCMHQTGMTSESVVQNLQAAEAAVDGHSAKSTLGPALDEPAAIEFTFSIPVPGIAADYLHRDFETLCPASSLVDCEVLDLARHLAALPATTTNQHGTRAGDPVNLAVIGDFATLISAFAARWDESETITLATCWKTVRAFLLGSQYRYSPVSPLYLFQRSQDVALQRIRGSINERLHLRLWLTPFRFRGQPVWIGQVSRDIGVRFTTKAWNLTTHRIDPDVDEARDYVVEDLLGAERIEAAGYVDGVGDCDLAAGRRNLTGDPYLTDGKRAVILLSPHRTSPRFVAWC